METGLERSKSESREKSGWRLEHRSDQRRQGLDPGWRSGDGETWMTAGSIVETYWEMDGMVTCQAEGSEKRGVRKIMLTSERDAVEPGGQADPKRDEH